VTRGSLFTSHPAPFEAPGQSVLPPRSANGHGVSATPENTSRCRHDRFPHPGPLPEGEGDSERAAPHGHAAVPRHLLLRRRALQGRPDHRHLREMVGEHLIEALPIGYTAVATDIDRQREIWFARGPLLDAERDRRGEARRLRIRCGDQRPAGRLWGPRTPPGAGDDRSGPPVGGGADGLA
jgi:hypothetical protein